MAPLFYRNLQADLRKALDCFDQDYRTYLELSPAAMEELEWWINHFTVRMGRA